MACPMPDVIHELPEEARTERCRIGGAMCTLDDAHFFVYCDLMLPIHGASEPYTFGVWSTLSAANYRLYREHIASESRAQLGPFFGWLANDVSGFPPVRNMKCRVHPQPLGNNPRLELEETQHPLSVAQHRGLAFDRILDHVRCLPGIAVVSLIGET